VCELSKKGQEGSTEFCQLRPEGSTAWVGFLESGQLASPTSNKVWGSSGERCKLPKREAGGAPTAETADERFSCILRSPGSLSEARRADSGRDGVFGEGAASPAPPAREYGELRGVL